MFDNRFHWFMCLVVVFALGLAACSAETEPGLPLTALPDEPTLTPPPLPTLTSTSDLPPTETPPPLPTLTPSPTLLPTDTPEPPPMTVPPPSGALGQSLYLWTYPLADPFYVRRVWWLDPAANELIPLSPPDVDVAAVGINPIDGRLAYGTSDGLLYLLNGANSPELLVDARVAGDQPVEINGIAWHPTGTSLAYTLRYPDGFSEGDADGLWLLDLATGEPVKLLPNSHMNPDLTNVNEILVFADPRWSPDGQALLLTGYYWEWSDVLWFEPVAPDPERQNLTSAEGDWPHGAWTLDGEGILHSGQNYAMTSDLALANRTDNTLVKLVDGEADQLYISHGYQVPAGFVFLGIDHVSGTTLYIGQQTEAGFSYNVAGTGQLLCEGGPVRNITWDPTGELALVACSDGLWLEALDGSLKADLRPLLGDLVSIDYLRAYWIPTEPATR